MALRVLRQVVVLGALIVGGLLAAQSFAPIAQAQTDGVSDGEARTLFDHALEAYTGGRFDEAARGFRRAYLLSPRFALLYNIGQSELRAGHDALALEAFEAFLRQAPADHANYSEVSERVRVLRAMGVREPASQLGATTPTPPAADLPAFTTAVTEPGASPGVLDVARHKTDAGLAAAPWVVLGGGAAALVVGGVLMGMGASSAADVTRAPEGSRWADLEGTASSAKTTWAAGLALVGIGFAAATVGLVWELTGSSSTDRAATARLRVSPVGVRVEGEF